MIERPVRGAVLECPPPATTDAVRFLPTLQSPKTSAPRSRHRFPGKADDVTGNLFGSERAQPGNELLVDGRLKSVVASPKRFAELNPRVLFVAQIGVKPFREQEAA